MKTGKVSDTILSRSVLKPVNTVRGKYVKRLDIRTGCRRSAVSMPG